MPSNVLVRQFQLSDAERLTAVWEQVLPDSRPWNNARVSLIRKASLGDGMVFVAEQDGEIVGGVKAGYDGVRGWIYSLAVLPQNQRCGIGRQLLQSAETCLSEYGCPKVNLQVLPTNSQVVAFYERCGYLLEQRANMGKVLKSDRHSTADTFPRIQVTDEISLSQIWWDDRPAYLEHLNETDEFQQNTCGISFPYTEFAADQWLSSVVNLSVARDRRINMAIRAADGKLIGEIGAENFFPGEQGEIGYWLAKPYWGQGIMPSVVRQFCGFAFEQFGLQRIYAKVFATNPRSARVLSKAGFTHEGTLRNGYFRDGHPVDDLLFGMLSHEYLTEAD